MSNSIQIPAGVPGPTGPQGPPGPGGSDPTTTKGDLIVNTGGAGSINRQPVGADGTVLSADSTQATGLKYIAVGGTGTVTSVSVVSANGLAGSVATATTTPAITLSTSVNGIAKANGTAFSTATAGTDYTSPSSTETMTNKSISGSTNTLSNIPNSATTAVATNTNSAIVTRDASGNFAAGTITASLTGHSSLDLALSGGTMSGAINMGANLINAVTDPVSAQDAATKNYVDTVASQGVSKGACVYATAAALPANTYSNGSSGVGATLTGNAFGALSVDGNVVVVGQRILVKNEVAGANNGIYTVTVVGAVATLYVLTRATDFNSAATILDGSTTYITSGATLSNETWQLAVAGAVVVGTTALVFNQIAGAGTIPTQTAPANQFFNSFTTPSTFGAAQPAFTNISGTATATQGGTGIATYATGDMIYASATNTLAKLAAGTNVQIRRQAAGLPTWDNFYNISVEGAFATDFEVLPTSSLPCGIFIASVSGTAATVANLAPGASSSQMGVIDLQTGSTSTGYSRIVSGSATILFGNGSFIQQWTLQIPTASTTGVEQFQVQVGCFDTNTVTPTNACGWVYDAATSANFITQTSDNTTRTTTTSSTAVPIGSFFSTIMVVNAAGTSVSWYLNNLSTLIGTNTTNIPIAATHTSKVAQCMIIKSVGGTSRSVYIDAYSHMFRPGTAR